MIKESTLQMSIVEYLSIMSARYGFLFFAVPNEGYQLGLADRTNGRGPSKKDHARMMMLKKMGLTPGVSDLVVMCDGRAYCLEVKTIGGRQSDNQVRFQKWCDMTGVSYSVVQSVGDVERRLKEWGVV